MMNHISKEEFSYRFSGRNRPNESDNQWDQFLENFSLKFPELDSYRNSFFLIENGLGDQVCVLGLLDSFRKHFKSKNIIAIANKRSLELLSLYKCYDKLLAKESLPEFKKYFEWKNIVYCIGPASLILIMGG